MYLVKSSYLHIFHAACNLFPHPQRYRNVQRCQDLHTYFLKILILPQFCGVEKINLLINLFDSLCSYRFSFLNLLVVCLASCCWLLMGILTTMFFLLPLPPHFLSLFFALQMSLNLCHHCCMMVLYSNIISQLALQWWKWPYEVQGNNGGGNRPAVIRLNQDTLGNMFTSVFLGP